MANEDWLPLPGLDGYAASSLGRIASLDRKLGDGRQAGGTVLAQQLDRDGYPVVTIRGRTYRVCRLVLLAFRGPCPPGQEALHRNDKRADSRLRNLRWGTRSANAKQREKAKKRRKSRKPIPGLLRHL